MSVQWRFTYTDRGGEPKPWATAALPRRAFRQEVEIVVNAEERFAPARITGIGVEDVASPIFVEHAGTRGFIPREVARVVVIILALRLFVLRKRYAIVMVELVPVRRYPLEAPAHAFLERFDLGNWRS